MPARPPLLLSDHYMLSKRSRVLIAVAALLLAALFVFPLWSVYLNAPQYPEGIGMHIWINTITGVKEHDLQNINGLNHYIGMKRIEPDAIPELRLMPFIVVRSSPAESPPPRSGESSLPGCGLALFW